MVERYYHVISLSSLQIKLPLPNFELDDVVYSSSHYFIALSDTMFQSGKHDFLKSVILCDRKSSVQFFSDAMFLALVYYKY